jgi:hypothetical protein
LRSPFLWIGAASAFVALGSVQPQAQVTVLRIDPHATDAAIEQVHGPHLAAYHAEAAPAHKLLVFLPGTKDNAERSLDMYRAFASWGYHAVGLDYENNVITVICAHSQDAACFDHYREAIVTGAPESDKIKVDTENSILCRLEKLLLYLEKTDPGGEWGEFVEAGRPAWGRIVVAGHSQGAGHAAYIGKIFPVDRVLIFSGPQDFFDDLNMPAPWQAEPSATPLSRYFAFLNVNDPYNERHQLASCEILMGLADPEPLMVRPGEAISGEHHILLNDVEEEHGHGSTISLEFENVWKYMATVSPAATEPPPPQPRTTPER